MRARTWPLLALSVLGCGAGGPPRHAMTPSAAAFAPSATIAAGATGAASATRLPEQLVVEGTVALEVDEIKDLIPALRATVERLGGRVIGEAVAGAELSWSAELKVRVPPDHVEDLVAFLGQRGEITAKRITATDVSKQLFDQDLALKNLRTTHDRLTQLMATGNLAVAQILEIERELTRLRGEIEQLEGDKRFLQDRVGLATLEVSISRRAGAVTVAHAKAYPGVRAATLILLDPAGRAQVRGGAGLVVHTFLRAMSLEVDVFQKEPGATGTARRAAAIATLGGAAYSDFLGGGTRAFLNPYLGLRLGYAYLDSGRFAVQAEAGLELFKSRYLVLDANVRATGLLGSDSDLALVGGAGATVAF